MNKQLNYKVAQLCNEMYFTEQKTKNTKNQTRKPKNFL